MMDERIWRMLEEQGWKPSCEFEEITLYENMVHCGDPTSVGDIEGRRIKVLKKIAEHGTQFAVIAKGDSMRDAGIFDGDVLMVRNQNTAEVGDIVLVCVEGDEMMIKNYMKDDDGVVWFVPGNDEYPPLCIKDYPMSFIVGKVVNVQHQHPRAPFNQCMKRIREAQKNKPRKREYTAEQLRNALKAVMEVGLKNRHWYAVYRAMVDKEIVKDGDYNGFYEKLTDVLGNEAPTFNLRDIQNMEQLSFAKPISQWDIENAPVKGTTFFLYQKIGNTFKRALE